MGASHSVVTTLRSVLKQCGLKVVTKTIEGFVKGVDRIAPWFACSGSLTIPSWEKLRGDLVGEQENSKLKAGNNHAVVEADKIVLKGRGMSTSG